MCCAVLWSVALVGDPADIATVEFDFGDGGHSYQAAPEHTYLEPGRVFTGFATVVDRRGQAVTQVCVPTPPSLPLMRQPGLKKAIDFWQHSPFWAKRLEF